MKFSFRLLLVACALTVSFEPALAVPQATSPAPHAGTTAGTFAAGNDPRIVNALQPTSPVSALQLPYLASLAVVTPGPLPDDAPVVFLGPHVRVNEYQESGETGNYADRVLQGYLGNANRMTGTQTLQHFESVSEGSGAIGAPNADYGVTISHQKRNWSNPTTPPNAGEIDGLSINVRQACPQTGSGVGKCDATAILSNVGSLQGDGFVGMFEGINSSFDPKTFALVHQMDIQAGVIDSRDGYYVGYPAVSTAGTNDAAFSGVASTGSWTSLIRAIAQCSGTNVVYTSANPANKVFDIAFATGAITQTPCGAAAMTWANVAGTEQLQNAAGTSVFSVDQGGNAKVSTITSTLAYATPQTFQTISVGYAAAGEGTQVYCHDCLKPGETAGHGTGMPVFHDASGWFSTAGTAMAK